MIVPVPSPSHAAVHYESSISFPAKQFGGIVFSCPHECAENTDENIASI